MHAFQLLRRRLLRALIPGAIPAGISPTMRAGILPRIAAGSTLAATLLLSACGGGGGDGGGGAGTPLIVVQPAPAELIVGQAATFHVEGLGAGLSFAWEQQAAAGGDFRPAAGTVSSDGFVSDLLVTPVAIAMDKTRFRSVVSNANGSTASSDAQLSVVWGRVSTLDPNTVFEFGAGAGGFGSADGGSPGGGDGEGAGVGGGLGKTRQVRITINRVADGASLGQALTGANTGLARVKAGPGAAPLLITLQGTPTGTYYDEGKDAMLAIGADQELHALVRDINSHLGVTTLTEAAYRYALNNYLQDPAQVRAGTLPLKRTATPEELARLTPAQIQAANEAIRSAINRVLPARYALPSITTLPTPVDNTSPSGSITNNIYGGMQVVVGGLSLAAARFEPSLANPALRMNAQLADDLTDGVIDGLSLDARSVFGPAGSNAYSPDSLEQILEGATDAQVTRFGDSTFTQPLVAPVITSQPVSAVITEGNSAKLTVAATGSLLNYQWFRDGRAIAGETQPTLETNLGGSYFVQIRNSLATVTSAAVTVTVTSTPVVSPPTISTQPASASVFTDQLPHTFSVVAAGTNLRYQWRSGGVAQPGATEASYSASTAGSYDVVITNAAGSITSATATLTVNPRPIAPSITTQPVSVAINPGTSARLEVAVSPTSSTPLSFQWFNATSSPAVAITNAIASSYVTSTAGSYYVEVSNSAGRARSNTVTVTLNAAPTITTQPQSATVTEGQTTTLTVVAAGTAPLAYQWRRDGTDIAGATAASYTTGTAGSYTVVVSNSVGNVTSSAATITLTPVVVAPSITTQPASVTINQGDTATLTVVASGTSLTYQWRNADGPIAGATSASYSTGVAGAYTVVVSNTAGTVTSTAATVTVTVPPSITTQPASVTINQGATTTLSVVASGTAPLGYQWRLNGTAIAGATSATYVTGAAGSYTVVVSNAAASVTSSAAVVTVIGLPSITTQPASVTIAQGQSTTLSVVATGAGTLTYQWRLNGTNIAGATLASYSTGAAGSYTVVVSNSAGSVTSNPATVTVIALPSITTQPASVTIAQGQSTTLSVVAAGAGALTYQWRLNGTNIAGATLASYSTGVAGSYTVVVTNSAGSVTSNPATVTVIGPPSITTQPASVTINQGQTATLTVVASGASLTYQWRNANGPIAGATSSSYTTGAAGPYTVVVTNAAGSVTSSTATVTVIVPPTITTQPQSVVVFGSDLATLSVVAAGTAPLTYQWQVFDSGGAWSNLTGETATSYSTYYTGDYRVVVTNAAGTVTSSVATVSYGTSFKAQPR